MKSVRTKCGVVGVVLLAGLCGTAWAQSETSAEPFELAGPPAEIAPVVQDVSGQAQYRVDHTQPWQTIAKGEILPVGAMVRTGLRSEVTVAMPSGQHVRVGSITRWVVNDQFDAASPIRSTLAIDSSDLETRLERINHRRFDVVVPQPTVGVQLHGGGMANNPRGGRNDRFDIPAGNKPNR